MTGARLHFQEQVHSTPCKRAGALLVANGRCPTCASQDVKPDYDQRVVEAGRMTQRARCRAPGCFSQWLETFELTSVEVIV